MMRLAFFLPLLLLAACQPDPAVTGTSDAAVLASYDVFGAALTPDDATPVEAVLAEPERFAGQQVKLEGTVSEVCQMRGCWATLVTDAGTVRIQMPRLDDDSDYVFTLPKDLSGQRIVATGTLESRTITADEQRHYDEDAGDVQEVYEDQVELRLVPTGVLVPKS